MQLGPFQLSPAAFALDRQEQMQLQVVFEPERVGEQSEVFTLKCDNGTQMEYRLSGKGQSAGMILQSFISLFRFKIEP